MASIWVLHDNSAVPCLLGHFSSREKAESFIHPSLIGTDAYTLEEVPLDSAPFEPGEVYGPVYWASVDLETGEDVSSDQTPGYHVRREEDWSRQSVDIRRSGSIAFGRSAVSYEAALANARLARDEHLASGKPTREGAERVWIVGEAPGYPGRRLDKTINVKPGVGEVHVPILRPEGGFGQLTFTRTDHRTSEGLPIFEPVKEPAAAAE